MNPDKKNCFTCKYNKYGGYKSRLIDQEYTELGVRKYYEAYPQCSIDGECGIIDLETLKSWGYNLQCKHYQQGRYDFVEEGDLI